MASKPRPSRTATAVERYKEAFRDGTVSDALLMDLTITAAWAENEAGGVILPSSRAKPSLHGYASMVLSRYAEYGFKNASQPTAPTRGVLNKSRATTARNTLIPLLHGGAAVFLFRPRAARGAH
jgi:hypothetical protein